MSQSKQVKKVKTYRALKVVFYFLGLPLFLFAVFCSAIKFIGEDPFVGTSSFTEQLGFFIGYERFITSPALFGIWCAFGVWAIISICHLILAKTVKNNRARMFSVLAIVLVVMVGGTFVMDAVLGASIDKMIETAPAGVTIDDYQTQLSYYTHVSFGRKVKDLTYQLKDQVQLLEKVYNVEWQGMDKSGVSGNIANKPIDYYYILSDPDPETGRVEQGVDISFAYDDKTGQYEIAMDDKGNFVKGGGKTLDVEGRQLVRLEPNENGELVINGKVYSHYFYVSRTAMNGETIYVWYSKDLMPTSTEFGGDGTVVHKPVDGIYGKGLYNESGLLSDGWIFSFENVLNILEDYYEAKAVVDLAENAGVINRVKTGATSLRENYYKGRRALPSTITEDKPDGEMVDPWISELYDQEVVFDERFSLTRGDLEYLLSNVGAMLGDNALFDWLLTSGEISGLLDGVQNLLPSSGESDDDSGNILSPILGLLSSGKLSLGELLNNSSTMATVIDWIRTIIGRDEIRTNDAGEELDIYGNVITDKESQTPDYLYKINDVFVVLVYKNDNAVIPKDHLYVGLFRDNGQKDENGKWMIDLSDEGKLLDIDFDDGLLDGGEEGEYNFDFDRLSEFLNKALNGVLKKLNVNLSDGIINTILGLVLKDVTMNGQTYKGLVVGGISIPLLNASNEIELDINGILTNLLQTWYVYQSPVIKPVWEFYEEYASTLNNEQFAQVAQALAKYERALYEASTYGSMIGSTLIGDSLGGGKYDSSFGLADLASVQQLKYNLQYQRIYFPLYSFRDMLLSFSGLVLLFYFLSFVAAEKERKLGEYVELASVSKEELEKEMENAPSSPSPDKFDSVPKLTDEKRKYYEDGEYDYPPDDEGEAPIVPVDQNNEGEVK